MCVTFWYGLKVNNKVRCNAISNCTLITGTCNTYLLPSHFTDSLSLYSQGSTCYLISRAPGQTVSLNSSFTCRPLDSRSSAAVTQPRPTNLIRDINHGEFPRSSLLFSLFTWKNHQKSCHFFLATPPSHSHFACSTCFFVSVSGVNLLGKIKCNPPTYQQSKQKHSSCSPRAKADPETSKQTKKNLKMN